MDDYVRSDCGDGFSGSVLLMGVGYLALQGRWTQTSMPLTVAGTNGTLDFDFRPAGEAPAERPDK